MAASTPLLPPPPRSSSTLNVNSTRCRRQPLDTCVVSRYRDHSSDTKSAGVKRRNGDLRSPADRRLLSDGLPRRSTAAAASTAVAAGSNFDHGWNKERIPGDVGSREKRVHRVLSVGVNGGKRERKRGGGKEKRAIGWREE